jgi:hypothetical protein
MGVTRDVTATLTYLSPNSSSPTYISGAPGEEERPTGSYDQVAMAIRDARALSRAPDLEAEGFCLIKHETRDVDFRSDRDVTENYYPQIVTLLKRRLSADGVIVFDHNVRVDADRPGIRRPARHVHCDYTVRSAIRRVTELVEGEDATRRLSRRFMQVNVWRPLEYPIFMSPLALADASSVDPGDYVRADIVYPGWKGEILEVMHRPSHKWFYFPEMTPDEALVFKGYDSGSNGTCRRTPHTAFDDPNSPIDAMPRISIEFRAVVFF